MESCDMQYELDSGNNVLRKGRKLLAEKKRRARINTCLGQIKNIICGGQKQNDPNYSKMEKAEILESTVKYLRTIRRDRTSGGSYVSKAAMNAKYKSGFSKCAEEIANYLQAHPGIPEHLQRQIRVHLSKRIQATEQTPSTDSGSISARLVGSPVPASAFTGHTSAHGRLDNSLGSSPMRDGNSFSESDKSGPSKYGYFSMSSNARSAVPSSNQATLVHFSKNHENETRIRAWLQDTYVSQGISRYESRELFSYSSDVKSEDVWRPW